MLPVNTWYDSMASDSRPARRRPTRPPVAHRPPLRRSIGRALVALGLLVAAGTRPVAVPRAR
ncbi:MAG TPA: hypothetical protein VNW68_04680 [Candidatus Limnocylindria bacterium]|jgi:hypothetical protein|nr:hypothetical protein [Candidatus Limnocylindria bacterium]